MKPRGRMLAVFIAAVATGHLVSLAVVPGAIMSRAMRLMEARGFVPHEFVLMPRLTPQTQTVVRPSPDLAYSLCPFDFSRTYMPLEVRAGAWAGYGSISFFDAQTNNFATVRVSNERGAASATNVVLLPPGGPVPAIGEGEQRYIQAPSVRGVILIRRIAPTASDYSRVRQVAVADQCTPMSGT